MGDKASALILFDDLETACNAVSALKSAPVAAVELADRAALRSVENKPGLPEAIRSLGPRGAALLVETRAPDAATLAAQVATITATLAGAATVGAVQFSTDPAECARYWNVRKGMFPSVGAMRETGTTVIIEDVAFPVPRLAAATLELQQLLADHGYDEAIIFGHALEGNLHFVFTQDFNVASEVARYRGFMDALCRMVVETYDGSLKAEHGTGRNMAPFVELEWGADAFALMREIKRMFDPACLLNPGVILNDDKEAHLKHLKPLPACDTIVDKCIECGFCEVKCPSNRLTLSPRQRIVGWREIARRESESADAAQLAELQRLYDYQGIDTCAGCGLCATACPVGIETGILIKALRGRRATPLARRVADVVADHFGAVTAGVRVQSGHRQRPARARRYAGHAGIAGWSAQAERQRAAQVVARIAPARAFHAGPIRRDACRCGSRRLFSKLRGAQHGGAARTRWHGRSCRWLPSGSSPKAGFGVVYPQNPSDLCCGQPFESKGLAETADRKSAELERALRQASENGRLPIVFDTSPCAYRMKRYLAGRLTILDSVEFIHDAVLPRVSIERPGCTRGDPPGLQRAQDGNRRPAWSIIARQCSADVVTVEEVLCCGFAGDKGFNRPELNEHALRKLKSGLPADVHGRLLDQPHLRDRPV